MSVGARNSRGGAAAGADAETIRAMRKNGARMRPADASAYIVMGHAQEMAGNFAEALEAYAEAKRLQPSYSAIYEGMGRGYGETGELEKAVAAFEQAIEMERGNAPEYSCELAQFVLGGRLRAKSG